MNKYKKILEELTKLANKKIKYSQLQLIHDRNKNEDYHQMQALLREHSEFLMFDNKFQTLGAHSMCINFDDLIDWLIKRAKETNPETALQNLVDYVNSDMFITHDKLWLNGLRVEKCLKITDTISLCPVFSLLQFNETSNIPEKKPTSYLNETFKHPIIHRENPEIYRIENKNLELMSMMMLLMRKNLYIHPFAYSSEVPADVPVVVGSGCFIPFATKNYRGSFVMEFEILKLKKLYEMGKKLTSDKRDELLFYMRLFNQYIGEKDNVFRAISLRTFLEALYIDDRSDQITKDIKKRVMKNCGKARKARKHIGDIVVKLYDVCSSAAHNGKLSKDELDCYFSYEKEILDIVYADLNKILEGKALIKKE